MKGRAPVDSEGCEGAREVGCQNFKIRMDVVEFEF
jgi:hypothetical protein